jgi:hypothetical protein
VRDEQPYGAPGFPAGAARTHQDPRAFKFFPVQGELQLSVAQCRVHFILLWVPHSDIPQHDGSTTIFTFRYDALELCVLDRMVFGGHWQPVDVGIERRSLGTAQERSTPFHSSRKS